MIVVTGANGQIGRQIVNGLLETVPAEQLGVSVQDVAKADELSLRGVRVRHGDFSAPASLAAAFEGAEQVLIVSVNKFGSEAVEAHRQAIDAARLAGVKRILYTSHQCASAASAFVPGRTHAQTEDLLQASGLAYVSLRNGFYAESALGMLGGMRAMGKVALPQDGPVSWTSRGDLAQAAVAAITQPGLFDGISPALTASETLDFADIAAISSEILGQPIPREVLTDEAFHAMMLARGLPEALAQGLGSLFTASRAGEFAVVDPTLERVLGRKPASMKDALRTFLTT